MKNKDKKNKKKGFTLIEIVVVVLIIGVLAAISVPAYFRIMEKSRTPEPLNTLASVAKAEQIRKLDKGEFTEKVQDLDLHLEDFPEGNAVEGDSFESKFYSYKLYGEDEKAATATRKTEKEDDKYELSVDYTTGELFCRPAENKTCKDLGLAEGREFGEEEPSQGEDPCETEPGSAACCQAQAGHSSCVCVNSPGSEDCCQAQPEHSSCACITSPGSSACCQAQPAHSSCICVTSPGSSACCQAQPEHSSCACITSPGSEACCQLDSRHDSCICQTMPGSWDCCYAHPEHPSCACINNPGSYECCSFAPSDSSCICETSPGSQECCSYNPSHQSCNVSDPCSDPLNPQCCEERPGSQECCSNQVWHISCSCYRDFDGWECQDFCNNHPDVAICACKVRPRSYECCTTNPSHTSCEGWTICEAFPESYVCCTSNPEHPSCDSSRLSCTLNPGSEDCCQHNPAHESCQQNVQRDCEHFPGSYECCFFQPNDPSCVDPVAICTKSPGTAKCCDADPTHFSCSFLIDGSYCEMYPGSYDCCKYMPSHSSCPAVVEDPCQTMPGSAVCCQYNPAFPGCRNFAESDVDPCIYTPGSYECCLANPEYWACGATLQNGWDYTDHCEDPNTNEHIESCYRRTDKDYGEARYCKDGECVYYNYNTRQMPDPYSEFEEVTAKNIFRCQESNAVNGFCTSFNSMKQLSGCQSRECISIEGTVCNEWSDWMPMYNCQLNP